MARTYIPTLRQLLRITSTYTGRYQSQLSANMTPEQIVAFLQFINCVVNLIDALGEEDLGD